MHTVDEAVARDRPVFAVPGPVTSAASAGTNRLIAEGAAPLCATGELLEAIGSPGTTVGAVAAHWRFGSASRFAAYYRQAFGVLPSQTMGQRSLVSAAAG